jgi:hypothetical protein
VGGGTGFLRVVQEKRRREEKVEEITKPARKWKKKREKTGETKRVGKT